ncbi:MAG: adenine deaminase [Candidatus Kapabacteria bacterium]|nr:adenine deaminase [Candidatus Kapabacteria bacterium]
MNISEIEGNIVDVVGKRIFPGIIKIQNGFIDSIKETEETYENYIMPGFVDAHVHIESSMMVPSEFARLAVLHGTVATVSDPHEIANVCGMEGIRFMINNGDRVPFKFFFGAPSCVPATTFETAGAVITPDNIRELLEDPDIKYLSEMMNFPGVLYEFPEVMEKINIAHELGKKVDGHAPGLKGENARKYIAAGISTDHECFTLEEALDKLSYGMKILIREGTAAKNFETLNSLLTTHPEMCMLCSDDKHPDDLVISHINKTVSRAVEKGHDLFNVLRAATYNPVKHYKLEVGLLQINDPADFIIVSDLIDFPVMQTYINGDLVANLGQSLIKPVEVNEINNFSVNPKMPKDFEIQANGMEVLNVIEALDGELVTRRLVFPAKVQDGLLISDVDNDILKIAVVNRYSDVQPAVAFIRNFGIKKGAIASSVGHDSHNIIAVGVTDEDLCKAVNAVIDNKGGLSAVSDDFIFTLPLPVGGLMSYEDGRIIAEKYHRIDLVSKELGSRLHSPFMTLSFMALLVIPSIKLSDKGLFDGDKFAFMEIGH